MISADDRLKIFRDVCHSYPYYLACSKQLEDKLTLLQNRLEQVYSPSTDKIGSTPTPHELDYIAIIEEKEELQGYKQYYDDMLKWITDVIDDVTSPAYKALIWMTYVQRKSLKEVSAEYLVSKDNLYRIRKKHLLYILSDRRMNEYREIQLRQPPTAEKNPYM